MNREHYLTDPRINYFSVVIKGVRCQFVEKTEDGDVTSWYPTEDDTVSHAMYPFRRLKEYRTE
jgi:hypothetical protein